MAFCDFFRYEWAATPISVILVGVIIYRRLFTGIYDVPGPLLASFSRLWHIRNIIRGDHNLKLIELHKKQGYFIRISHNEVSVSHPDAVQLILHSNLNKAPWYRIMAMPDYRFQSAFSSLDSRETKDRTRAFSHGYTTTNLLKKEDDMDLYFKRFKTLLDTHIEGPKTPLNLDEIITYTTYDLAGQVVFSEPFGFLDAGFDIQNSIRNTLALNLYAGIAAYFYPLHTLLIGNPFISSLGILPMGHLFNITNEALGKRLAEAGHGVDMVGHWLHAQGSGRRDITDRDIFAQTLLTIAGASDEISIATQSFVYHMIRHPAFYQQLRDEIDAARAQGRCQGEVICFADAKDLPFLQACIKESMRVFGPIGTGLPRVVGPNGLTIHDRTFRPGTVLSVNPWVIHYSQECWGSDADKFNPHRWFAEDIAQREKFFIPYGAGYASCAGQNLARIELSKLCATIVRDYDITPVDAAKPWSWKARITVMPKSWPVYIQKRKIN